MHARCEDGKLVFEIWTSKQAVDDAGIDAPAEKGQLPVKIILEGLINESVGQDLLMGLVQLIAQKMAPISSSMGIPDLGTTPANSNEAAIDFVSMCKTEGLSLAELEELLQEQIEFFYPGEHPHADPLDSEPSDESPHPADSTPAPVVVEPAPSAPAPVAAEPAPSAPAPVVVESAPSAPAPVVTDSAPAVSSPVDAPAEAHPAASWQEQAAPVTGSAPNA